MEITVANKIIVKNPTEDIKKWCASNLVLDNPDYYKKVQMGKWVGNTPRTISLYEVAGNELRLPFGCLQDLWKMVGHSVKWSVLFEPIRQVLYQSNINLYDYQKDAVQAILGTKNGILVMPCGSGKTQCGIEAIARIGGRALWLTHTQELLNQSKNRAESVLDGLKKGMLGTITGGKVNIGTHITFATIQTMCNIDLEQYRDFWDIIVVDECMPANTLIDTPSGKKELKNLCINDIVTSYNGHTQKIECKRVVNVFRYKAHDIVRVNLETGKKMICTKNHPIYTKRGYINAERLNGDDYVMQLVWKRDRMGKSIKNELLQKSKEGLGILFQRMCLQGDSVEASMDRQAKKKSGRNNEENSRKISRANSRQNDKQQSNEKRRNKEKGIKKIKRNRASTKNKMRKWKGTNSPTANIDACTCENNGSLCRISNTNKNAKKLWLSDLLQNRYCNSRSNDCNRSRWKFPLCSRKTKTRRKERAVLKWVRVDSVEVQKQTSDGTFGGLCQDGYVYNIEVEDNNNYFADGYLVHNCQRAAGSPTKVTQFYKVLSNLSARYKIGLTATPHRADGLEKSMFALLGGIAHEVSRECVKDKTCEVVVNQIFTNWYPADEDILCGDGTIDYHKVVESMVNDKDRFECVLSNIPIGQPTLVLANRVEYLQRLCDSFDGKAICISGAGQSKKAKEERRKALARLNAGEVDCVFATYSLAAEGLDVPNLRYVVLATPEKDSTRVQQTCGRVGRKADNKEVGIVLDFIDDFGMYKSWWKKRQLIYKKLGYNVV